jgi:hypothetical protein
MTAFKAIRIDFFHVRTQISCKGINSENFSPNNDFEFATIEPNRNQL